MIGRTCILLLLSLLIIALSNPPRELQAKSITITASRSSQLANLCANTNRASLYTQYGSSTTIQYSADFARYFTLDKTVFSQFLDLDVMGVNDSLRANTLGYATYIAPAFVGAALLILLAPLMLVCLCCPMRCCLRKKLQYTYCEQSWPVLVTMVLATAVGASCIIGMSSDYKIYIGYQQLSCAGVIGVDDALYGATNRANTGFFAGVSTINTHLQSLNTNFNLILGNFSTLSSSGSATGSALNLMNGALYNISAIPDPSGANLSLNYNSPISSSQPTGTISSTFPSVLGTATTNSSLVGTAYAALSSAQNILSAITSAVDTFRSQSSAIQASVSQMINDTAKSVSLLRTSLLTVSDIFVTQNYFDKIYYVQFLFYGVILGMMVVYLLFLSGFACCGKMCCRYPLYIFGFLLFLVALVIFAVFLLLGFSSAIFYSGCSYIGDTISNSTTFVTNVGKLGIDATIASQFSVCLAGQNGDILGKISGDQNRNNLRSIQLLMNSVTSFDGTDLASRVNAAYAPLTLALSSYASGSRLDIADSSAIQELKYISTPSNFNCTSGNFQFDSWVPSIRQVDNAVPCRSPQGMPSSDNSTCTSTADFNAPTLSCEGCMDTFSLLYNASSQAAAFSMLSNRYVGCSTFNTQLANIWQNYYLIKKSVMGSVGGREYSARQSVQAVSQSFTQNLAPTFQSTISKLYATSPSVLTPNYGVLWGLDCSVLGEDMVLFQQASCNNSFSYSYFHRIICMVIAFSLLVLLCCNTCVIFRRRKNILEERYAPNNARASPYLINDPLSNARLQGNHL